MHVYAGMSWLWDLNQQTRKKKLTEKLNSEACDRLTESTLKGPRISTE
jgi:hypothetical protein